MNPNNKQTVIRFIEEIWNQNRLDEIDKFVHSQFIDYSLPPSLPSDKDGLKAWITGTGNSFDHKTIIEELVSENDKVMVKIKMELKHIGTWRGIKPTGKNIFTRGYRYFKFADHKIIEHWALVDGTAIENQLTEDSHGCKIQN